MFTFCIFCWWQQKNNHKKRAIFDVLMTLTLNINMITRWITSFFSSTFWALSIVVFHFKTFKIQFYVLPLLSYVLVCKMHISITKMTLSKLLTKISVFYIKFANVWYIMCFGITCFVPNLIPIWPQSHAPTEFTLLLNFGYTLE